MINEISVRQYVACPEMEQDMFLGRWSRPKDRERGSHSTAVRLLTIVSSDPIKAKGIQADNNNRRINGESIHLFE